MSIKRDKYRVVIYKTLLGGRMEAAVETPREWAVMTSGEGYESHIIPWNCAREDVSIALANFMKELIEEAEDGISAQALLDKFVADQHLLDKPKVAA